MRRLPSRALLVLVTLAGLCANPTLASAPPDPPTGVTASDLASPARIDITWHASDGATRYVVYRADALVGPRTQVAQTPSTSYADADVALQATYYYWVSACNGDGCSAPSEPDQGSTFPPDEQEPLVLYEHADLAGASHTFTQPGLYRIAEACPELAGAVSSLDLTHGWSARVWRNPNWNGPSADFSAWNRDLSREMYTDGDPVDDTIQSLQLWHTSPSPPRPTEPAAPSNVRATDGEFPDIVRLTWNAVPSIDRYRISRAAPGGESSDVCTTTHLAWDDTSLEPSTIYTYAVSSCVSETCSLAPGIDTGYAGSLADAYEPDDNRESASQIAAGQTQRRSIYPAGDVDWAWFSLDAPSQVALATGGPSGDTILYLYDAEGCLIAENDDGGQGRFSRIDLACEDRMDVGVYYVKIREYGSPDVIAQYTLSVDVLPCPDPEPTLPPPTLPPTVPPATLPALDRGLWLPVIGK